MRHGHLGFCRPRMGHLKDRHSVRPPVNVLSLGEGEEEDMAGDKDGDIDQLKSAEKGTIDEEDCDNQK